MPTSAFDHFVPLVFFFECHPPGRIASFHLLAGLLLRSSFNVLIALRLSRAVAEESFLMASTLLTNLVWFAGSFSVFDLVKRSVYP